MGFRDSRMEWEGNQREVRTRCVRYLSPLLVFLVLSLFCTVIYPVSAFLHDCIDYVWNRVNSTVMFMIISKRDPLRTGMNTMSRSAVKDREMFGFAVSRLEIEGLRRGGNHLVPTFTDLGNIGTSRGKLNFVQIYYLIT